MASGHHFDHIVLHLLKVFWKDEIFHKSFVSIVQYEKTSCKQCYFPFMRIISRPHNFPRQHINLINLLGFFLLCSQ